MGSRTAVTLAAGALVALSAGCATPGTELEAQPPVAVLRIAVPIHEPVFSFGTDTLLGLTDDHRIASIEVSGPPDSAARTSLSQPFESAGRNIQVSPHDDSIAFLPQPTLGHVAAVRIADLRQVATLPAGPHPSYLSQDSGADLLLSLSADRSTVTAVDLHRNQVLGSQPVSGGPPETTVEGAKRGRVVEFHVSGPDGIVHYKGHEIPAEKKAELPISVADAVTDPAKVSRAYLAEKGADRLVAVDTERGGDGLHVVGEARLGEPIRRVAVDDTRIYAATDTRLVVLASNSFGGFRHGRIPVLRSLDYRGAIPNGPARSASLAGIAVGHNHVYLALDGQPYVIRVAKPRV